MQADSWSVRQLGLAWELALLGCAGLFGLCVGASFAGLCQPVWACDWAKFESPIGPIIGPSNWAKMDQNGLAIGVLN